MCKGVFAAHAASLDPKASCPQCVCRLRCDHCLSSGQKEGSCSWFVASIVPVSWLLWQCHALGGHFVFVTSKCGEVTVFEQHAAL